MKVLNFARRVAFYILDALKGGVVRKAEHELARCDSEDANSAYIIQRRNSLLEKLLLHATTSTEFYKTFHGVDFEHLPTVNKGIIVENQTRFLSNRYKIDSLIEMRTSGSTGTPFVCYQDKVKKKHVNAECIYYTAKLGYRVGDRLTYLQAVARLTEKSKLKQFIQNQKLVSCNDLSKQGIEGIISESINKTGYIIGYASTFDAISRVLCENKIDNLEIATNGIICGAEMLYDKTRQTLVQQLRCQVVSRYSNEENGILGQDDKENNVFLINEADYYIEILKLDIDEHAEEGEVGRIVVTDLYNYAMPMIRYDTGDLGAIEYRIVNGKSHRVITKFAGRRCDSIYDSEGRQISPHIITNTMWEFPEIVQFQFVQKTKSHYLLKINSKSPIRENLLRNRLEGYLGENASLEIQTVDEIPVLHSGKRKYILNDIDSVQ